MSEFPKSGVGSWAEWRRRVKKAGAFDLAVDSKRPSEDDDWWNDEHQSQRPRGFNNSIRSAGSVVEQDIADRKAG